MANVNIKIGMDNRVKPGQQTRNEVLAALQARGIPAQAAEHVWDPITGELVQTFVNLPDTAAAQATQVIDANAGVAIASPPLPDEFRIASVPLISAGPRLVLNGVTLLASQSAYLYCCRDNYPGSIAVMPDLPQTVAYWYARMLSTGQNVYRENIEAIVIDGVPWPTMFHWSGLHFANESATPIVIPANTISIKVNGTTVALIHGEITVPAFAGAIVEGLIGADRKIYPSRLPDWSVSYYGDPALIWQAMVAHGCL